MVIDFDDGVHEIARKGFGVDDLYDKSAVTYLSIKVLNLLLQSPAILPF